MTCKLSITLKVTITTKVTKSFYEFEGKILMLSSDSCEITIIFRTSYQTYPGQQMFISGDHQMLGEWSRPRAFPMRYVREAPDSFNWVGRITFRKPVKQRVTIEYKYILLTSSFDPNDYRFQSDVRRDANAEVCWDSGPNRKIVIGEVTQSPYLILTSDLFQSQIELLEHVFLKNTFRDVIYFHPANKEQEILRDISRNQITQVHFRLLVLQLPPGYSVYITGDSKIFENWKKYIPLVPINNLYWEFSVDLPKDTPPFDYKYLVLRDGDNTPKWEHRPNHKFQFPSEIPSVFIISDWMFKFPVVKFHGAGILVSLYSIHSKNSFCRVGEFLDLKQLIVWAEKANLLLIHILPIQDTDLGLDGLEMNPSRQVSAFAFNPIHLTLSQIEGFTNIDKPRRASYQNVYIAKIKCLRQIFSKLDKPSLKANQGFKDFVNSNNWWLQPYCLWASIRDQWLEQHPPNPERTDKIEFPPFQDMKLPDILSIPDLLAKSPENQVTEYNCLFIAWVQYHCHLQMMEVGEFAKQHRIVLSSTMTIGQRHGSADCWSHQDIFDESYNIGAPPDIFSFHGQNWGYPAWNWEQMRKTNYQWIRQQIFHKSQFFSSCLFDHPLGLFRCWNIPADMDNPLLGHFVPSSPVDARSLSELGLRDISQLCRPIFPINDALSFSLPDDIKEEIINMLATCEGGLWRFRAQFETDTAIKAALSKISQNLDMEKKLQFSLAEKILLSYFESVCLIPERSAPHEKYYPRFSMTDSAIFKTLPERDAQVLYKLFVDFYYRTNLSQWHENGAQNIGPFASAPIQFFGYDLGVTLNDEEKALHRVGICSFRVQRIPRESTQRFDVTEDFPYMSICTPSPHDMPHLTLWWRQEQADVQLFYHQILKMQGVAPLEINKDIARGIVRQNLASDSMWCVFVFDDLFALSDDFKDDISDSWINDSTGTSRVPYKMSVSVEDLNEGHAEWNELIVKMIQDSGRGRDVSSGFDNLY